MDIIIDNANSGHITPWADWSYKSVLEFAPTRLDIKEFPQLKKHISKKLQSSAWFDEFNTFIDRLEMRRELIDSI